mgnify:CR=1 FL=1
MADDIQELLDAFADVRTEANVNRCFGEPVTIEGRTVIPVAKVSYGFGMGAEQAPAAGPEKPETQTRGPYGGGVSSSPLGVIEVTREEVRVKPTVNAEKVVMMRVLLGAWGAFWLARVLMAIFGRRD